MLIYYVRWGVDADWHRSRWRFTYTNIPSRTMEFNSRALQDHYTSTSAIDYPYVSNHLWNKARNGFAHRELEELISWEKRWNNPTYRTPQYRGEYEGILRLETNRMAAKGILFEVHILQGRIRKAQQICDIKLQQGPERNVLLRCGHARIWAVKVWFEWKWITHTASTLPSRDILRPPTPFIKKHVSIMLIHLNCYDFYE